MVFYEQINRQSVRLNKILCKRNILCKTSKYSHTEKTIVYYWYFRVVLSSHRMEGN